MEISVTFPDNLMTKESLTVKKKLSSGEFHVFQVHSPSRKTSYILKLFPKTEFGTTHYQKEKLMFSLRHPNIIQRIPAIYFNKDFHPVLTEFSQYGDVFDLLERGFFNNEIIVRTYFQQLIEGVEYIHSQGIAHLDLKLENLMLGSNFTLKIIDFDQAQKITDEGLASGVSTGYRAPEVVNKTCKNLMAVDIYCLGVILYAFKTREFPFADSDDQNDAGMECYSIFMKNNQGFWKNKADLMGDEVSFEESFIEIINGMLCAEPEERWTIEQIKKSRWYQGPVLDSTQLKAEMKRLWENNMSRD